MLFTHDTDADTCKPDFKRIFNLLILSLPGFKNISSKSWRMGRFHTPFYGNHLRSLSGVLLSPSSHPGVKQKGKDWKRLNRDTTSQRFLDGPSSIAKISEEITIKCTVLMDPVGYRPICLLKLWKILP